MFHEVSGHDIDLFEKGEGLRQPQVLFILDLYIAIEVGKFRIEKGSEEGM